LRYLCARHAYTSAQVHKSLHGENSIEAIRDLKWIVLNIYEAEEKTDTTVVRDMQGNALFLFRNDFNISYFQETCPKVGLFRSNATLKGNMMRSASSFFDE
jgi:peptide subunit release factor RF-3